MPSLLEILRTGGKLRPVASSSLHYSQDGAANLARVEEEYFWFVIRREILLANLRRFGATAGRRPSIGLEVGCGTGYTCVYLAEKGYPTVGVDAIPGFKRYQKQGYGFLEGDILSVEPVAEFDFLLLLDVLEHIEDDTAFLAHALKFLKPGGIALITVPALGFLWSRIDDLSLHFRRYDRTMMSDLVRRLPGAPAAVEWQSYFFLSTLPLYAVSRLAHSWFKNEENAFRAESEIPSGANRIALSLLRAESRLLRWTRLPLGSSLFSVIRRNG